MEDNGMLWTKEITIFTRDNGDEYEVISWVKINRSVVIYDRPNANKNSWVLQDAHNWA